MKKNLIYGMLVMLFALVVCTASAVADDTVTRDLPDSADAGATITVNLTIDVGASATQYCIDEIVPSGWTVTSATDGGDYTSDVGHVKWFVSTGAADTVYSYIVEVPADASGTYTFNGTYAFEGMTEEAIILGDTEVTFGESVPGIVINEFVANPSSGNDWVELYNPTGSDISLDGWTLNDSGSEMESLSGMINASGYRVFEVGNRLNQNDDTITLLNGATIVDEVTYGSQSDNAPVPTTDESAGRFPNGADTDVDSYDFQIFGSPTPGAANAVTATYGVTISQPENQTTPEGVNATYLLTVTNKGNVADTYTLDVTNIDGATTAALNMTTIALDAGALDVVALDVTNVTAGTFNVTVNATSLNATNTTDYIMTTVAPVVADDTVTRDLPDSAGAGATITVDLTIDVETGATQYCIDEIVPSGWTVTSATDGGDYTSDVGHVKWFVSSGAADTVYSYIVEVPADASGTYTFNGTYAFEGMTEEAIILGDTEMTVNATANPMTVTAVPTSVHKDITSDVLFNVTSDGTPVDNATVTLYGCGVDTNGTTDENGTVTISVTATIAGTIDVTATKDEYAEATTGVDVTAYPMTVTADPTSMLRGTTTNVTFNVTSDGAPVDGALVTLSGCGVDTDGTTDENGTVTISVTATSTGTITVIATKDTYDEATTTVAVTTSGGNGGNGGSSGGDGTYPPGWGEGAPSPAATSAPEEAASPAPTKAPTVAPTKAPTKAPTVVATETTTTEMKTEGTPGFGAVLTVFAIAGLLVAAYLVMRRRE